MHEDFQRFEVNVLPESELSAKKKKHCDYLLSDPGFFLGGGALVSCSTSTPINHIVLFFFAEYQLYQKTAGHLRGGGGGGGPPRPPPPPPPPPPAPHPLHPPPRSAPDIRDLFKKL